MKNIRLRASNVWDQLRGRAGAEGTMRYIWMKEFLKIMRCGLMKRFVRQQEKFEFYALYLRDG